MANTEGAKKYGLIAAYLNVFAVIVGFAVAILVSGLVIGLYSETYWDNYYDRYIILYLTLTSVLPPNQINCRLQKSYTLRSIKFNALQ